MTFDPDAGPPATPAQVAPALADAFRRVIDDLAPGFAVRAAVEPDSE
jgi:hypothetical protein